MGAAMAVQQRGLAKGVPNPIITFERARSWATSAMPDRPRAAQAGAALAWLALAPAAFDVGENVFLLRILAFGALKDGTLQEAAYWLATVTFGLLGILLDAGVP